MAAVVPDMSKVTGAEQYDGPEAGKELLQENGFVVVPRYYHQLFSIYWNEQLPHYATTDSVHSTFHAIFEDELKKVEVGLIEKARNLTVKMRKAIGKGKSDDQQLAHQFFSVAENLLQGGKSRSKEKPVAAELELILSAQETAPSPLFGYVVDYSQFKPRGLYTESEELGAYFRVITWYGTLAFRLKSQKETEAACRISEVLASDEELTKAWKELDGVYAGFLGPCDDLTPIEYAEVLKNHPGNYVALASLRNPKINSMVLSPDRMPDWMNESKGMRFLGKRYLPDSDLFLKVTFPKVPARGFPTGLDVLAANGSAHARRLIEKSADAGMVGYKEGLAEATATFSEIKAGPQTHYVAFLKMLESLARPPLENAPAFVKTEAYAEKNLMTSLGAWAAERHAWALHAKQSITFLCAPRPEEFPGYVEPNPQFFDAMHDLIDCTIRVFASVGGDTKRFQELDQINSMLRGMVDKELAGTPFEAEERHLLLGYAMRLGVLQGYEINADVDSSLPWMSEICDVHTEMASGSCLEVARGGAMPIYVALEVAGEWHLCIGGVYSYYEFLQPMKDRLTDDEWRAKWDAGKLPELPTWTGSFVSGAYDAKALKRPFEVDKR